MTRNTRERGTRRGRPAVKRQPGYWLLQDAKARFSELVRRARSHGPQHVTVHGRDEVVVLTTEEYRRLAGVRTGQSLVDACSASPYRELSLEVSRQPMPVRRETL